LVLAVPLYDHPEAGEYAGPLAKQGDPWYLRGVLAHTQTEFLTLLSAVLKSTSVLSVIQSLIARSNEVQFPPGVKIEVLTEDEPTEARASDDAEGSEKEGG